MAKFFIDRPVFAWVIALFIVLAGLLCMRTLPISQYPTIAPPSIVINATYPGASAAILDDSVTSLIEQELNGADGLQYIESQSQSNGTTAVTATFWKVCMASRPKSSTVCTGMDSWGTPTISPDALLASTTTPEGSVRTMASSEVRTWSESASNSHCSSS